MKDKKWLLKIILTLIIIIVVMLIITMIFGSIASNKKEKFYTEIEDTACKYVSDQNVTPELCEAFNKLCKVYIGELINNEYLTKSIKDPVTKQLLNEKSYVQVSWKEEQMICEYKEG